MRTLINRLTQTTTDLAPFVSRLFLGAVMLPHGLQKTLGLFGGYGFSGTMTFFTENLQMPYLVALMVIAGESLGALALILGFFTRFCAASIAVIMIGAITMAHWQHGFFMNWFGNQAGEGIEYHLLAIGLSLSLVLSGGGRWSIDGSISKA